MVFFPHSLRSQYQQHHTTAQNTSKQLAQCNFHHACSCVDSVLFSIMLKDTHTADYVGQSFPEVGWYGKICLYSLWILVVKSAVRIWVGLDGFFPHSLRNQHQQHHTTAQNTSNQLAQCNFHHACSCMGSVLFSIMLKETHAVDYVGQSFPEVGWSGKICLFSLWILVVKGAVKIWIGLDVFFFIAHFVNNKQYHTTAQNTSKQLAQCNFHHVCSCMDSVLFSNMLKETHAADYVG